MVTRFVLLAALLGCGKSKEADKTQPSDPPAAPKVAPPAKPAPATGSAAGSATASTTKTAEPAAPSPNLKRCQELISKAWKAVQPGLVKLQATIDEAFEKAFTSHTYFLEPCAALAADKLECLEKADNPIDGIATCDLNAGATTAMTIYKNDSKIGLFPRKKLEAAEAETTIASLEGTWVNEWAAIKERTTWTIAKDGTVTKAEVLKDGQPKDKAMIPDKLHVEEEGRLKIHWKNSSTTQTFSFVKIGNEFYANGNTLYDAYEVPDQKKFVVRSNWTFLVFDGGKCEAIDTSGLVAPATCAFVTEKGNKLFKAEWKFASDRVTQTSKHVILGKHFLHETLFEAGRYRKR